MALNKMLILTATLGTLTACNSQDKKTETKKEETVAVQKMVTFADF